MVRVELLQKTGSGHQTQLGEGEGERERESESERGRERDKKQSAVCECRTDELHKNVELQRLDIHDDRYI